jgi:hypothetical protein
MTHFNDKEIAGRRGVWTYTTGYKP